MVLARRSLSFGARDGAQPERFLMSPREFDIVIYGATGYTGEHGRALSHCRMRAARGVEKPWAIALAAHHGATRDRDEVGFKASSVHRRSSANGTPRLSSRWRRVEHIVMNAVVPYRFYELPSSGELPAYKVVIVRSSLVEWEPARR